MQQTMKDRFKFTGFYMSEPMLPYCRNKFIAPEDHCTFYLGFVTHDSHLNLIKKLAVPVVGQGPTSLQNFLADALS